MVKCEYCGHRNDDSEKCCWACGAALAIPKVTFAGPPVDVSNMTTAGGYILSGPKITYWCSTSE